MINENTAAKVEEILQGHCYAPMKEQAEKWLAACKADDEDAAGAIQSEFVAQLKDSVATVPEMLTLFSSDEAKASFGEELAGKILAHAQELDAAGKKFCDCPACTKAQEILADFGVEL